MGQISVAATPAVLLTVDQLAQCLHKSVASVRSDATRNPKSLPPICRLPGTKRLLWRAEDVESCLAAHVAGSLQPVGVQSPAPGPSSRRGRPTKAEQVERQRRERSIRPPETCGKLGLGKCRTQRGGDDLSHMPCGRDDTCHARRSVSIQGTRDAWSELSLECSAPTAVSLLLTPKNQRPP